MMKKARFSDDEEEVFRQQMLSLMQPDLSEASMQQLEMRNDEFDHQISVESICHRRVLQYLYHIRNRPEDNNIGYWRKLVMKYYAPTAKKRLCLSMYENLSQNALGVCSKKAWSCDVCGSKAGKGYEANVEILPRLYQMNFGSGMLDELLFLDVPQASMFPSGVMMLEYDRVTLESIYEHSRVIREGKLRVVFTQDLRILSWEFCAWKHEDFLACREVVPQVYRLVDAAQKCQSTISRGPLDVVSRKNFQSNISEFVSSTIQLTRTVDLPMINELGFSKRYVRCLESAEVLNFMKDLMDFSISNKIGPLESLEYYSRVSTPTTIHMKMMRNQHGSSSILASQSSNAAQMQNTSVRNLRGMRSSESINNADQQLLRELLHEMTANRRPKNILVPNTGTGVNGNGLGVGSSMRTNLLPSTRGSAEVLKTTYKRGSSSVSGRKVMIKKEPYLPEFNVIESFPDTDEE